MDEMSKNRVLDNDGVQTVNYTLEVLTKYPLYTKMQIFIHPPPLKVSEMQWCLSLDFDILETQWMASEADEKFPGDTEQLCQ